MAAKMLENARSSAFRVRISIRRPLWRGEGGRDSGPEGQCSVSYLSLSLSLPLSLPLSLSLPPSGESQCGSTLYWIMLEHECTRTISKTRSREVLTEREGTPCPSSSQTKSKSLREGGGNCPRTNSWTMKVLGFGMRIGLGRNTDRIGIDRDWCKKKKRDL